MLTDKHRLPSYFVIPAQAGIQAVMLAEDAEIRCCASVNELDSGLRRNDDVDSNANP